MNADLSFRRVFFALLMALLVVGLVGANGGARVNAASPQPGDKNSGVQTAGPAEGVFGDAPPAPGSKNSPSAQNPAGSDGAATRQVPLAGSKNSAARSLNASNLAGIAPMLAGSSGVIACGVAVNFDWTTTATSPQVINQCTLSAPVDGYIFISASGSLALTDSDYEGLFNLGVDAAAPDGSVDRWVNVYADAGDGTDETVALSVLKPVTAGNHTVYFLGQRAAGTGTVTVYDPSLSVIFIPAAGSEILACGGSGNQNWSTTSSTAAVVRSCSLTLPQDGLIFFSADASIARSDGEFEIHLQASLDAASPESAPDRWVNLYNDSGDGTDKSAALSFVRPVSAGAHTFNLLASRYAGTATATLYDPTVSVIYIPLAATRMVACGDAQHTNHTISTPSYQVLTQCTLTVPQSGWVFISADASLGFAAAGAAYEGRFEIGVDNPNGDANTDRWVNIYTDATDGTDKTVALNAIRYLSAGTHTFYMVGRLASGAGPAQVYDPMISVLAPGAQLMLPAILKGS